MKNLLLLSALFLSNSLIAQIEATTSDGKQVILNSDGTWSFVEEKTVSTESTDAAPCSDYIETTTDKMTGKTRTLGKEMVVVSTDGGKTGFGHYFIKGKTATIWSMNVQGGESSCIDKEPKILILFTDGTRTELYGRNDFNCDGDVTVYLGGSWGTKKVLNMLLTKKVETMRVWTYKSYVQKDFSEENQYDFHRQLSCIMQH